MNANIGITEPNKKAVAKILQQLLADEFVLSLKTRNFHWNVVGSDFHSLHLFFEGQYNELDESMDALAERIRQLGILTIASLADFSEQSRLEDPRKTGLSGKEMIKELLADHETMIRQLRTDLETIDSKYDDAGNSDYLTGLMQMHEKMAWMLRSSNS